METTIKNSVSSGTRAEQVIKDADSGTGAKNTKKNKTGTGATGVIKSDKMNTETKQLDDSFVTVDESVETPVKPAEAAATPKKKYKLPGWIAKYFSGGIAAYLLLTTYFWSIENIAYGFQEKFNAENSTGMAEGQHVAKNDAFKDWLGAFYNACRGR